MKLRSSTTDYSFIELQQQSSTVLPGDRLADAVRNLFEEGQVGPLRGFSLTGHHWEKTTLCIYRNPLAFIHTTTIQSCTVCLFPKVGGALLFFG